MDRSRPRVPRPKTCAYCAPPAAADWRGVGEAIAEGWHVMLVWDADRWQWRCDLMRYGLLCSGDSPNLGAAVALAWEATGPALAAAHRRRPR